MNYGTIKKYDIADGSGVRVSLFVSGCTHHCKGCFNAETWSFDYGQPYTQKTEQEILDALKPDYIEGFTVLGGEPFEPANQRALLPLLKRIKEELPKKTVWAYSGYLYEELTGKEKKTGRARCEVTDEMLSHIDVLVDGEFVEEKKNISLQFRGSENQRLIDVKETSQKGRIVFWKPSH